MGFNSDEVLISSNDDRVRLFTIRWPQQPGAAVQIARSVKYSGHSNSTSQLRASFSWDGRFISSASDDRCIYFWKVDTEPTSKHPDHQKRWERYRASESALTSALMAPPSLSVGSTVGQSSTGAERPEMAILTASFSGAIKVWAF